MESIKSPHVPALLFAGLHRRLQGTVTVVSVLDIANFAFTWPSLGLSSYPQFTYKTIKINTYKRSIIEKTFIELN